MVAAMASARGEHDATDGADFGFRRVGEDEKPGLVRDLFDRVAGRYDLMNDLMSGGVHRLWKREMVAWLAPRPGMAVLDVAGGTGDIARASPGGDGGRGPRYRLRRERADGGRGPRAYLERGAHRRYRVAGWRCGGAAAALSFGGCLYDRLRHPQPDQDRAGAGGGRARAPPRRALSSASNSTRARLPASTVSTMPIPSP